MSALIKPFESVACGASVCGRVAHRFFGLGAALCAHPLPAWRPNAINVKDTNMNRALRIFIQYPSNSADGVSALIGRNRSALSTLLPKTTQGSRVSLPLPNLTHPSQGHSLQEDYSFSLRP